MAETRTLRVQQKTFEATDVTSLTLVDPTGAELPGWTPGCHVALTLSGGLVREYSLCSDPADRTRWTVAVLKTPDSRGGSYAVHHQLQPGELVEVAGPRDNFAIDPEATRHLFVAGGVGITPIIAMVREVHRQGGDWQLLYAGRSRSHMAFLDELATLPADRVTIHADDDAGGSHPDLAGFLGAASDGTTAYACGPAPLLDACAAALPEGQTLRVERFSAPEPVTPAGDDQAFEIVVKSTGDRIRVPSDVSVLDALNNAGIEVPSSCTEGICGTCEVAVLSGDIDHRDFLFTEEEHAAGNAMMACVSRCRSAELVLDL